MVDEQVTNYNEFATPRPPIRPGKRVLLAFFVGEDQLTSTTLSEDIAISQSMDPLFVYSLNWVTRRMKSWQAELDNEYLLQDGIGTQAEKRTTFYMMITTAILSCQLAGGEDIWISICGPEIHYNNTTGRSIVRSSMDTLFEHIRAIEPDVVAFVNRDFNYVRGAGAICPTLEGGLGGMVYSNTVGIQDIGGMDTIMVSSTNRSLDLYSICDETDCKVIMPALLHESIHWRSQYKPIARDVNGDGVIDGTDLQLLYETNMDAVKATVEHYEDYYNCENPHLFLTYGDLYIGDFVEAFSYIQVAPAASGLFTTAQDVLGYRPFINKDLGHPGVWSPLEEYDIEILKSYWINPVRATIRNGITLAGNHSFYGADTKEDVKHPAYPLTRMHNVILAHNIAKELCLEMDQYIGKGRQVVVKTIPKALAQVMTTKPVVKYDYSIIDVAIDQIDVIINLWVMNEVSSIKTTASISNIK